MPQGKVVWELTDEGASLDIFNVDPRTRQLNLLLELRRVKPMTEEEAQKYIEANYPEDGNSVRCAADALGIVKGKS